LRAKRSNLGFKEINNFEIATSQKTLLAMTFREFFSKLLVYNIDKGLSIFGPNFRQKRQKMSRKVAKLAKKNKKF